MSLDPNPSGKASICEACGAEFYPRARNQKYCGQECKRAVEKARKKAAG